MRDKFLRFITSLLAYIIFLIVYDKWSGFKTVALGRSVIQKNLTILSRNLTYIRLLRIFRNIISSIDITLIFKVL